jgi:hypothetical protein
MTMLCAVVHESAIGTKRTCPCDLTMSALWGRPDISIPGVHVRL